MISNKNILKLETRRKIYSFIEKNPGLHLREIGRRTNTSLGGLRHHLDFLKKHELVITKSDGGYTRYYLTKKIGKRDKKMLNLLRQEVPLKIVMLLLCAGPSHIYKKKDATYDLNPSMHLKTYSKKEIVELTRYWKKPAAGLFHLQKHRTTIDFHLYKLLDAGIIKKVPAGMEIKYKLVDEDMAWAFLIKYQKTLSNILIDKMLDWQDDGIEKRIDAMLEAMFDILPHPYHA